MLPRRIPDLLLYLLVFLDIVSAGNGQSSHTSPPPSNAQVPAFQLLREPTGASRCEVCHRSEVEGYARSAMAHSLRRAGQEPDGTVTTPDTKITMHSSPAGYWQQLESGGEVTNYRIDYVIGSGNHAAGYLLDAGGHLFQSPVAYYKSRHAYDLAPGYEGRTDPDFTRPVLNECVFCHSGTALPISGTLNQYRYPAFSAEAITCERCHGSAEKHLSDPRAGTIINPAKLERAARDSICEQCHLLGVGRVLNPEKKFSDFRPGQRLEDVFTTYCNALPPGSAAGKFKVISQVEELAKSTCARASNGQLWCGTCHDPHNKPLDPVAFYRSKCLSCHAANYPDSHPGKDRDCISCHMPRRDAKDGGHSAFTDHRIQRRPEPQPGLPENTDIAAWREPAPDLQKRNLGIAYINTGMERRSQAFLVRGYRLLTEVQNQFPTDSDFFTSIGNALLFSKQPSEAEFAFDRVLQLNPDSAVAETNAASAYLQTGDVRQTIAHLERAVAIDPMHLPAVATLINLYKQQGNLAKAAELSEKITAAMDTQPTPGEAAQLRPADSSKMAETSFKNIQVLKGISPGQLILAMRFITASLGVECNYCHVPGSFDRDDKKTKQIARNMMRMMLTVDKNSFEGNREVTCYSCHRGSLKPAAIPVIASEAQPRQYLIQAATPEAENLSVNSPSADEIIGNYIQALGGANAIEKITSRKAIGSTSLDGKPVAVEILDQYPDKRAVVRHMPAGDSVTAFNGRDGWSAMQGHPLRDMHGSELDAAQMDADLHFPLHLKNVFDELRVDYPEKIGTREAYVVFANRNGLPPVKLYFDEQSGLLVRLIRYADSPLGLDPTQIDYGDYRDTGGVETPFRWTVAEAHECSTIQLEQVQQNVPIDDATFAKPVTPVAERNPSAGSRK